MVREMGVKIMGSNGTQLSQIRFLMPNGMGIRVERVLVTGLLLSFCKLRM